MKQYGATNPEQIIFMFEMRAKIADSAGLSFAATAWREAADILRNTEFVGWTPGERIVADITDPLEDYTEFTDGSVKIGDKLLTATEAVPSVFLSIHAANTILAALERPQAVESARKYMKPRERHATAITELRAALARIK